MYKWFSLSSSFPIDSFISLPESVWLHTVNIQSFIDPLFWAPSFKEVLIMALRRYSHTNVSVWEKVYGCAAAEGWSWLSAHSYFTDWTELTLGESLEAFYCDIWLKGGHLPKDNLTLNNLPPDLPLMKKYLNFYTWSVNKTTLTLVSQMLQMFDNALL